MILKIIATSLIALMEAIVISGDYQGKVNHKGALLFTLMLGTIAAAIWL